MSVALCRCSSCALERWKLRLDSSYYLSCMKVSRPRICGQLIVLLVSL